MNFKDFLLKLQNLPEQQKKIILWTIVGVLGLIMGYFWINSSIKRLENLDLSGVKLPEISTQENLNK